MTPEAVQQLAAELARQVRSGETDPRRTSVLFGQYYPQDDIIAILERAAQPRDVPVLDRDALDAVLTKTVGSQMFDRNGEAICWTTTPIIEAILALATPAPVQAREGGDSVGRLIERLTPGPHNTTIGGMVEVRMTVDAAREHVAALSALAAPETEGMG